ncbi:MAG TPA: YCF48-related protein [Bacteroidales bacterium]|nr:YCF48-related protein [Bacteroidales bacterium]HSA44319.1 YCF48-related protein [Bacteroidales bacterium]
MTFIAKSRYQFLSCFLANLLFTSLLPAQQWQSCAAFSPAQTLHCIRFANDSTGYTVSSLYNGSTYNIHKTNDGGLSWTDQSSGYTGTRFKDIWTFSADTVMMCGNYGLVIRTTDGGLTWIADTVSPQGYHLFGISFDGPTGYVCGNNGAIYKTNDMGQTWTTVAPPFVTAIEEIYFLDKNHGFIAGLNFIYYTENGGQSWQQPQSFPGASVNWWLRCFSFVNDSLGFVCGDIGQVYKTTDGGKNWTFLPNTLTQESLQCIKALDENRIYVSGYAGTVIRSLDGGLSWEVMTAASSQHFYGMDFTPSGIGYVCSWSGEVLKYNGSVVNLPENIPAADIRIYPNPASNILFLDGDPDVDLLSDYSEISIFDANGMLLSVLPVARQLNLASFRPGLYSLVFTGNKGRIVKKVAILR